MLSLVALKNEQWVKVSVPFKLLEKIMTETTRIKVNSTKHFMGYFNATINDKILFKMRTSRTNTKLISIPRKHAQTVREKTKTEPYLLAEGSAHFHP
jgi:hypothetical protein